METEQKYKFDPPDMQQISLLRKLTPGQRIWLMVDARELAVGLIRGRLSQRYPDLPLEELNLKVLDAMRSNTPIERQDRDGRGRN